MRRSSQDRYLPPFVIQIFGGLIVLAVVAAGFLNMGNPTILLAALTVAAGFVLIGGYYEKIRSDVIDAVTPDKDP